MSKKICFLTTGIAVVLVAYLLIGWLKGGDKINQIREEALYGHLRMLMSDLDPRKRIQACEGLARLRDPRAVPYLIQALGDGYDSVRSAASWALVRIGTPAVPHLIQALQDEDRYVREAACKVLGRIGDPQAIPHLTKKLEDEDFSVRKAAEEAIRQIRARQAGKQSQP
jgi:hypothetical protein